MCVVDGCQAGEDVVEFSTTALQVEEITSPAYSQLLLSVELQQGARAQRQTAVRCTAAQQNRTGVTKVREHYLIVIRYMYCVVFVPDNYDAPSHYRNRTDQSFDPENHTH